MAQQESECESSNDDLQDRLDALKGYSSPPAMMAMMAASAPVNAAAVSKDKLPALDDLLQCFTAEGLFQAKHKDLLMGFLTGASQADLKLLLLGTDVEISFILTAVAVLIFEERFSVYKGEWELVMMKAKKKMRTMKDQITATTHKAIEKISTENDDEADMLERLMAL